MTTKQTHTPGPESIDMPMSTKKSGKLVPMSQEMFDALKGKSPALIAAAPELLEALKTWKEFWDTMPKGQMGKLSFDVGLFNDGFVKMEKAIAKAEGGKHE